MSPERILTGDLLGEDTRFTLEQLCRRCRLEIEQVITYVEEGIVEPRGERAEEWQFGLRSLRRLRMAVRLQRDLGLNPAGAALAIDLLERITELERRLR
jgi:chaperone modulatory protein CbpM